MPPTLLFCLARMGHGDEAVLADSNYPRESKAVHCVEQELIHLSCMNSAETMALIESVMPLGYFADYAVRPIELDENPSEMTEMHLAA